MPSTYALFGLKLRSDVPLPCPEVRDPNARADVGLAESPERDLDTLCSGVATSVQDDGFWRCALYENGAARVSWNEHFDFVVTADGGQVRWRRLADAPDEVVFTYLLGQVLSFCLLSRGIEPLHATSVLVDGGAIAFLGGSGQGKSTLAATLLACGHRLITDDVFVVKFEEGRALVYPGLARIKLTPESADAVFRGRRSVPMNSFTTKMIFPLPPDRHVSCPAPLKALYVIRDDPEDAGIRIGPLEGHAGLLSLIGNTFNDSVLHMPRVRQQFAFARELLSVVPIKSLSYPKRLDLLPSVADALLADATGS
jgi:hypothetical protein